LTDVKLHSSGISIAIEEYRVERERRLHTVLQRLPRPYAAIIDQYPHRLVRWAMLHHLYRTALHAARVSDPAAGSQLLTRWLSSDGLPLTDVDQVPVPVDASNATAVETGADMPAHAVDPVCLAAGVSDEATTAVKGAVEVISRLGYGEVVAEGIGVVVLLNRRESGEPASSWTTLAFPGTVYLDWRAQPELLAEDLVHEATHAWLNDALDARSVWLPPEELYYSPWKQIHRSAYGMIHSIMAFSRVVNLLTRLIDESGDNAVRTYCAARMEQEAGRLESIRATASAALAVIDDEDIADVIRTEYEHALRSRPRRQLSNS
jgi:HEXXH motif-containing protein